MNPPPSPADPNDGQQSLTDLPPIFELDRIVSHVLGDMGLGTATTTTELESRADFADFSVLHFLILPLRSVWLDFLLETDRKSARQVFKIFSGAEPDADSDLADVLRETMNMIHGSLKASFKQAGVDVIIPIVPQSIESDKLVGNLAGNALLRRHLFRLDGISLRLTMIARVAPITHKELKHFRLAEVLVDPINSTDGDQLAIVKKHTMLNRRLLEKVRGMAAFENDTSERAVIEPSPLAVLLPNE